MQSHSTRTDQSFQCIESRNEPEQNQLLKSLITKVNKLIDKNEHRHTEYDRRLSRMEVTVNKSFVLIGDIVSVLDTRISLGQFSRDVPIPRGFKNPKLPIKHVEDLTILDRDLRNKEFFSFLVSLLLV